MKFIFAAAVAATVVLGATAQAAMTPTQFPLAEQNSSGEHGTATLLQGVSGVIVKVRLAGTPEGVDQPAHIHKGTCDKLDPKPVYPLKNVVNGQSQTTIPNVTLAQLQAGTYAINVHQSTKDIATYVSCGNIAKK